MPCIKFNHKRREGYLLHFCPDNDWSIQSKCWQVISELKLVTYNLLFIHAAANWEATERSTTYWKPTLQVLHATTLQYSSRTHSIWCSACNSLVYILTESTTFTEALHLSSACTTLTCPSVHATISSVLLSCLNTNVFRRNDKSKNKWTAVW